MEDSVTIREIAIWTLTKHRDAVGEHLDLSDEELQNLFRRLYTQQQGGIMPHLSKDGVDKFMLHIQKAVSLRAEAELSLGSYAANILREESKDALRDAEYMVYELIDGAVERSKNQGGNIPPQSKGEVRQ